MLSDNVPAPEHIVKRCTKCGETKDISNFKTIHDKRVKNPYLDTVCRRCHHKRLQERRKYDPEFRKKYQKQMNEYIKKRYANDPEFRERVKENKRKSRGSKSKAPRTNATCRIIKEHHEKMKDDPEHLSTEFIQKLVRVNCP